MSDKTDLMRAIYRHFPDGYRDLPSGYGWYVFKRNGRMEVESSTSGCLNYVYVIPNKPYKTPSEILKDLLHEK